MRKFFLCMILALLSFGLMVNEASARRFGGGGSFGVQRSKSSLFSPSASKGFKPVNQASNGRKWGGLLGGMLIGGLLASLFMGNGVGAGLLSWLVIGGLVFFVINFLKKRRQPAYQSQSSQPFSLNPNREEFKPSIYGSQSSAEPMHFDAETFLREAKVMFYRLQTAYDQKNMQDLNAFTTPEVFAEIKMQIEERGDEPNKTEVNNLEAELLNVENQTKSTMASVRFSGFIKENEEPLTQFEEVWHFSQFDNAATWFVAGIQQEVL